MDRWLKKASTAFLKRGCQAKLLEVLESRQALELSALDEDGNASCAGLACAYCTRTAVDIYENHAMIDRSSAA